MKEDDWASVPAHKRPEIRRRIAIIRSFLAIDDPTPEDRARAMKELGLSRASFHNLVRVMQSGGTLSTLQGTGPAPGRTGGKVLDAVVTALIEQAIENVGPRSSTADVYREVERLCSLAGVTAPSSVTVRKRHLDVRKWLSTSADPTLVVDHCALLLPIVMGDRLVLPVVTAAFLEPEGLIVSYSTSPLQPACIDVAAVLLRCLSSHGQERRLQTYRMPGVAWNVLSDMFHSLNVPIPELRKRKGPGHEFRRVTGTTLGGIKLAIQSTMRPETEGRIGVRVHTLEAALEVIDEAVRTHNAGRGLAREDSMPKVSVGTPTTPLQQGLSWITQMPRPMVYVGIDPSDALEQEKT